MNLSTTQKVVLGIFTMLPLVLLPYLFIQFFRVFFLDFPRGLNPDANEEFLEGVLQFIVPSMILSFTSLGLLIFYLVHLSKNNSLNTTERLIWILIMIFGGLLGFLSTGICRSGKHQRPQLIIPFNIN